MAFYAEPEVRSFPKTKLLRRCMGRTRGKHKRESHFSVEPTESPEGAKRSPERARPRACNY
jgi:hypothetical protein